MPHYIEIRIPNGSNHEELTEAEMESVCDHIQEHLQEVLDITGIGAIASDKLGNKITIFNSKSYAGEEVE